MSNSGPGSMGAAGGMPGAAMNPVMADEMAPVGEDGQPVMNDETGETPADQETAESDPEEVNDEGSGGDDAVDGGGFFGFPSFPFPTFFRSFSDSITGNFRQSRQLYSPCVDRITLPCIVEDFIGAGMGDAPSSCIPVLCGSSLCASGRGSACKIETSVTPFHIGVHFGDGKQNKGSPENNIGACLRYKQLPCS